MIKKIILSVIIGGIVGAMSGFAFYDLSELWKPIILGICFFLFIQLALFVSLKITNTRNKFQTAAVSGIAGALTGILAGYLQFVPSDAVTAAVVGGVAGFIYGLIEL